jgi:hypothetical protein
MSCKEINRRLMERDMKQPHLRLITEFYGKAKTATGDVWWFEVRQDDGSVRRIPLMPVTPTTEPQS